MFRRLHDRKPIPCNLSVGSAPSPEELQATLKYDKNELLAAAELFSKAADRLTPNVSRVWKF